MKVIQPGPIHIDLNPAGRRGAMPGLIALERYGRADEIAALAAFPASDDVSYITGATINVDGGCSI